MVEHGLDFCEKVVGVNVVLLGHLREQQARVVELRVAHGVNQFLHQEGDDAVACQLDVDHVGGAVYPLPRQGVAGFVGAAHALGHVLEQLPLEASAKNLLFMLHEGIRAALHEQPDYARTEIAYLFVGVGNHRHHLQAAALTLLVEEIEQQLLHLGSGKNLELVGVLDVHYLVADVVGGLDNVDQRMAGVAHSEWRLFRLQ